MSKSLEAYWDVAQTLYERLPDGATTRVLDILPGDGELQLKLTVIDLNDVTPFDALSYTWGDQSHCQAVIVNGLAVPVTKNLYDALFSIRQLQDARRVWVDALCINQADLAERSAQIPRLLQIYQTARRVLVWLGGEDETTKLALQHAKMLVEKPVSGPDGGVEKIDYVKAGENALRALFARSWFRRIWVIQEVSVSKQALICLGTTRVSWQLLRDAADRLEKVHRTTYHALFHDVEDYQWGHRVRMLPMAVRHQDFEASDPRDKLYALLGLVAKQERRIISADYTKDVATVYKEFAIACLKSHHGLDIFAGASQTRMEGLPSWVPDWSQPRSTYGLSLATFFSTWSSEFNASRGSSLFYSLSEDSSVLHLKGHKLSTIESCTSSLFNSDFNVPFRLGLGPSADWVINRVKRISFYLECEAIAGLRRRDTTYPTQEPIKDVYWQVLCGGCHPDQYFQIQSEFGEWDDAMRTFSWMHKIPAIDNRKILLIMMTGFLARRTILHKFPSFGWSRIPTSEQPWTFLDKHTFLQGRAMMKTDDGYLGLTAVAARQGDEVWLLQGGKVPVVLRRAQDGEAYELLGEAYVHGVMQGEGFQPANCTDVSIR